jgi:chloramphenicol 3-O-phosphotransferase
MQGKIIFVTGAPASGKSTIARALAGHFAKSMHLSVDALREMMVSGVELPDHAWGDETTRQFQWARRVAVQMAQLYAAEGVDVVIDDVAVPEGFVDHYAPLFSNPAVKRILLLPGEAELTARIRERGGPFDGELVKVLPWLYSYLRPMRKEGWIVLDNSHETAGETVRRALAALDEPQ